MGAKGTITMSLFHSKMIAIGQKLKNSGTIRDGSGQNPTQDLTRPEAILANPTRPEPFFYEPEQPEEIFLPTRKYFFP